MLRIHDILGWIRILGSMPWTNGSGFWIRILLFLTLTFKMKAKKLFFNTIFSAFLSFFKDKKSKRVTKKFESRFFLLFFHDDKRIRIWIQSRIRIRIRTSDYSISGSGFGRAKNMWIRIRNTAYEVVNF